MGFGPPPNAKPPVDNKPTASIPVDTGDKPPITPVNPPVIVVPDKKLSDKPYVHDTFHNKVGVNVGRFEDVIKDLKGFAEGTPTKVTYYKEHYSETDIHGRSHTRESMNPVHKSVLKIIDFEIRMLQALQYEHDTTDNISKLTGEAITYPGFEPEAGDRLVLEIDAAKYGLFEIVNPPTRTSIRASTYFKIEFRFIDYMTEELKKSIESGVVEIAYFDKARFLNEPGALLVHDEAMEIEYFTKQRTRMLHYFNQKFMENQIMYSYMRPDGVYDPYVMQFMLDTLDFGELPQMAVQIFKGAPYIDMSIWKAIQDANMPMEAIPTSTVIVKHILGSKSVLSNSLINKYYTKWVDSQNLKDYLEILLNSNSQQSSSDTEGEIPADPSIPELPESVDDEEIVGDILLHIHPHYTECPWITGDETAPGGTGDGLGYILGDGEHFALMYHFLKTRKINTLQRLHELIEGIWQKPRIEQFYRMPIYIYLCKVVISYIQHTDQVFVN